MSQTFKSNGVDLGQAAVRLGQEPGWTEMADNGAVGTSNIVIDNPAGSVTIGAWKSFTVDEGLIAGNTRTFTGTAVKRTFRRGDTNRPSLRTGAANEIEVDVLDLNELLSRKLITGTDGNRPAETVSARLTWLLGSTYLSGLVADNGFVAASSVSMDANDYTGQNPSSVIVDCALAAHFNHFVYPDPMTNAASLWFADSNTSPAWNSGILLSNDLADINQAAVDAGTATTLWYGPDWSAEYDPTRCYSGVFLPYSKGHVYVTDSTIASNFTTRDGSAPNANVKTSAAATVVANNFLTDNASEDIRINCTVFVGAAQANAIKAGQLVQYKNTALPDFVGPTYCRVLQRSLSQPDETDQYYLMPLVLSPASGLCTDYTNQSLGHTATWYRSNTGLGMASNPTYVNDNNVATTSIYNGDAVGVGGEFRQYWVGWRIDLGAVMSISYFNVIDGVGASAASGSWITIDGVEVFPTITGNSTNATYTLATPISGQVVIYGRTQSGTGLYFFSGIDCSELRIFACAP